MILNIDLSPKMNIYYKTKKVKFNSKNQLGKFDYFPGGDGFTISKLIRIFDQEVFMSGFIGGLWKKEYFDTLKLLGISHDYIDIKSNIGTDLYISDEEGNEFNIRENSNIVTGKEQTLFLNRINNHIDKSNVIICSGGCGSEVSDNFFYNILKLSQNKKSILNTSGSLLLKSKDANPHTYVFDKEALESIANLKLDREEDILSVAKGQLYGNTKEIIINLEDKFAYIDSKSTYFVESIENTKKSESNLGLVAGLALSYERKYDLEMKLKVTEALNQALRDNKRIENLDLTDVKSYMNRVVIKK